MESPPVEPTGSRRHGLRLLVAVGAVIAGLAVPAIANATPTPVTAWYMFGTTASALNSAAYSHGNTFAANSPGGSRLLLLDFGGARKLSSSSWGAIDFSNTTFNNGQILTALENAADGVHNGYKSGTTTIAYGNSNSGLTASGMSTTDIWNAGYYQSQRASDLASYQSTHGYNQQGAAAGSDMEPSWDSYTATKNLVDGDTAQGYALYYDYGSADGCPSSGSSGSCNNGWTVANVAYVSYSGVAVPLPEIYFTVNANQWTVIRNNFGAGYTFYGTTAQNPNSGGLTPQGGWNALNSANPGDVLSELVCFGC